MENIDKSIHDAQKEYYRICPFCNREFQASHMNQKYCKEFEGRIGYCKDRFNHPRSGFKTQFKKEVIKSLSQTIVPAPIDNHAEVMEWLTIQLELNFDNVISEFVIGGQYGKRIDFCIKKDKMSVGVELKLARHLEEDGSAFVNELLGQLEYASEYFKKQLIVAVAGDMNFKARTKTSKLESLLLEKGIGFVFIQESTEKDEETQY